MKIFLTILASVILALPAFADRYKEKTISCVQAEGQANFIELILRRGTDRYELLYDQRVFVPVFKIWKEIVFGWTDGLREENIGVDLSFLSSGDGPLMIWGSENTRGTSYHCRRLITQK